MSEILNDYTFRRRTGASTEWMPYLDKRIHRIDMTELKLDKPLRPDKFIARLRSKAAYHGLNLKSTIESDTTVVVQAWTREEKTE